jgi:hypothetical protein
VSPFRLKASAPFGHRVTNYGGDVWVKGNDLERSVFVVELPTAG